MSKKVLIVLAQGFEEIEALTCYDIFIRAGLEVVLSGLDDIEIVGSRGLKVVAGKQLDKSCADCDAVVLPGGMPGAKNLSESGLVAEIVNKMFKEDKLIAAICASPAVVLAPLGILGGKKMTCYDGHEKNLDSNVYYCRESVVEDGNIITSRGPATAMHFALTIVKKLVGEDVFVKVSRALLCKF